MVVVAEIAPKKNVGPLSSMVNLVFVVASAVGPLIGGAITTYSTWRWCFYLKSVVPLLALLTTFEELTLLPVFPPALW